jgi:hypothetical protein
MSVESETASIVKPRMDDPRFLLNEIVPALAIFAAHMGLGAAFRATLLPALLHGLFDFRLRGLNGAEFYQPRLVGLLDCALRMDAAERVGRLAADRAKILRRLG